MMEEILIRIYKYCAYQDRCTSEVVKKLKELDAPEDKIPDFLAHLEAERMLDEERFARSFARGKFSVKRWGKQKIRFELRKKRVPENLISIALNEEIEEETYRQTVEYWVERKGKQWAKVPVIERKSKILRFLQQKGFEWDRIQDGLKHVS